jgi:hypothetical protein
VLVSAEADQRIRKADRGTSEVQDHQV